MISYFRKPNFVFFGSPEFAAIILEKLIAAGMPPALVVCNPDRPFGRKRTLTAPPVKQLVLETRNMKLETTGRQVIPEILQPERLDASFALHVSRLKPDFAIVAAYAKILPLDIIKLPRLGAIGVHPSLLPKYRGATPIQSAILAGETETGVTLFMLDKKVDHGPILANRKLQIANGETYDTLMKELGGLSGNLLIETLPAFIAGNIAPQAQNEAAATYTKKFTTEDGFVDLQKDPPELVARKIRALNPAPGVYAFIEKNARRIRVKLLAAHLADGKLIPTLIQVEGKKPRAVRGMEDV